jgi:hypothetical protein
MATPASFVGVGQEIKFGSTTLLHISDVTYSGNKVDTPDTTDAAAASGYRTFIPALKDAGECTVKGIWYPGETSKEALETNKGVVAVWVHTLPNSLGLLTFNGMITGLDEAAPLDKAGEFTLKIKISGPKVYSAS